jgi:hypothetical protein
MARESDAVFGVEKDHAVSTKARQTTADVDKRRFFIVLANCAG